MRPNPLLPGLWDLVWSAAWLAAMVLAVVALITLYRTRAALGGAESLLWALGIVVVPVLGPIVWLIAGRRLRRAVALRRTAVAGGEATR